MHNNILNVFILSSSIVICPYVFVNSFAGASDYDTPAEIAINSETTIGEDKASGSVIQVQGAAVDQDKTLIDSYRRADEILAVLDPNEPLIIPLDDPSVITGDQISRNEPDDLLLHEGFVAVQYVGGDGQVSNITARDLRGLFSVLSSPSCNGIISVQCVYELDRATLPSSRRYPTFDLIIYSPTGQRVLLQRVNASSFSSQALRATLNGELRSARTGRSIFESNDGGVNEQESIQQEEATRS